MEILEVLDHCARANTFPMLDNGYVYLADTRLALFRSATDWAMAIEVFGSSPRAGLPDLHVHTFASSLRDRDRPEDYVTPQAYDAYLANNPANDSRFFFPVEEGEWQDEESLELVAIGARSIRVRNVDVPIPSRQRFAELGIDLTDANRIHVFELCRYLTAVTRESVLATEQEQRVSVPLHLTRVLQLDAWDHPDLAGEELPSHSECFQQLARVLETGDVSLYRPTRPANTHWRHWPDGGRL